MGIRNVIITGIYTDRCGSSAVRGLADESFFVVLLEDCCAAGAEDLHQKESEILGSQGLEKDNAEFWDDRRIRPGELWDAVIKTNLQKADIALVLVSQAFLDSPYCQNIEIEHCLARKTHLFPIILSPCDWRQHAWPSSRQFLPGGDQTVEEHYTGAGRRKRLFLEIRKRLRVCPSPPFPARPRSPRATISAIAGASWPIILKSHPPTGRASSAATKPVAFGSGWKTAGVWANCRKG